MKRFQILPEALKDAIFSEKTSDAISKSCTLRDASGDKTPLIGQLTTRVLLGYLRPELVALEIQKETGIDIQKAQLVAHDLDMEIFSAVRLELKKLYPPTIQTPTVQSWMAQKPELRSTDYEVRKESAITPNSNIQPKPKYVIPIPEKFLKQTTDNRMQNVMRSDVQQQESDLTHNFPPKTNSADENLKSEGGHRISTAGNQGAEARPPISNPQPPYFKPIVPLPTFIQTQFRTTQVNPQKAESRKEDTTTPNSTLANDPRIKSIISKFTTSSTQKPKPPAESPYREKI